MGGNSPAGYTTASGTNIPGNQNFQQTGLSGALDLFKNYKPEYYGGNTYAAMNPAQTDAANRLINMGSQGSTVVPAAVDQAQNTMSGAYQGAANPAFNGLSAIGAGTNDPTALSKAALIDTMNGRFLQPGSNPWLTGTYDQAFNKVQQSVGGAMAGAGRFGSGAMAGALTDGGTNLANQIFGTNYQQERDRMNNAAGTLGNLGLGEQSQQIGALGQVSQAYQQERDNQMRSMLAAPSLESARYIPAQMEMQGGQAFQQNDQNQVNADKARFDYGQQLPYQSLNNYIAAIQGLPAGSTSSQSTPYFNNPTANFTGGALGVGALASLLPKGTGDAIGSGIGNAYNWLTGSGTPNYSDMSALGGALGSPNSSPLFDPSTYGTGGQNFNFFGR